VSHRADVLAAVASVVPCNYGDAAFTRAAPRYRQGGGTSCTFGPAWGLYAAGCREPQIVNFDGEGTRFDVGAGVSKLWNGARALGAWVEAGGGRRPQPGDLYLLHGPISGGRWAPSSEHVGTVESSEGATWSFLDFGQNQVSGDPHPGWQCARRVRRAWDGVHLGSSVPGGASRLLGGWVDVDALKFTAAPLISSGSAGPPSSWLPWVVLALGAGYLLSTDDED
jgi:hypothetical protein